MFNKTNIFFLLYFLLNQINGSAQISRQFSDTAVVYSTVDSIVKKEKKRFNPYFNTTYNRFVLKNEDAKFSKKLLRGTIITLGYHASITALLLVVPQEISKWNTSNYRNQFVNAYTHPPVIDNDKWYINYVGHPYQGAFYYNSMRSQGAKIWQSGLFCLGSTWLWEYSIEAGFEQPSIQDLIVTPCAGILLGELFHFSTIKMSRNGFKWYEKIFVCVFNPTFAMNNGFKYANTKKQTRISIK
jgi:hypothetical protein